MAMIEAQRIAATSMREKIFEKDYHDGWADWTRRISDTLKVDVAGDPYAMYFLAGTVPTGLGASFLFSSGAATLGTAIGIKMAYASLEGLAAGLAEGYISTAGQINMRSGFATTLIDILRKTWLYEHGASW